MSEEEKECSDCEYFECWDEGEYGWSYGCDKDHIEPCDGVTNFAPKCPDYKEGED